MTLNSRETEEFRRAAVRRKVKGAAADCHASHTGAVPLLHPHCVRHLKAVNAVNQKGRVLCFTTIFVTLS